MISLKKVQTQAYEKQFELILKESSFINELNRTLEIFKQYRLL